MWRAAIAAALIIASISTGRARAGITFGSPRNLGPKINSSDSEFDPCPSADGLELYFQSGRPGGQGDSDLYVATRATTKDDWGQAANLGPVVNSTAGESGPCLSADGLTLYFNSNRPGGQGGTDLYMTKRSSPCSPWGTPISLGAVVNSEFQEMNPSLSADGRTLFFSELEYDGAAVRPGGFGQCDIWMTTRKCPCGPWGPPVNLGTVVNSPSVDGGPCISRDGLMLLFSSNRDGGQGFWDLWMSTRKSPEDPWGAPVNLGAPANSPAWDGNAELSADGRTLYFASGRNGSAGFSDLWEVSITVTADSDGGTEQASEAK
jgi:Tol biopolymer transport system component